MSAGRPTAAPPSAVERFSKLGEHGAIWIALGAAGALADRRRRGQWSAAVRRIAISYGVNQAVKLAVRRRRPAEPRARALGSLSFPSAHATTSFCAARSYARLGLPALPLYALAGGLAASRLYLRLHHPSDVVAGVALGTALAR